MVVIGFEPIKANAASFTDLYDSPTSSHDPKRAGQDLNLRWSFL